MMGGVEMPLDIGRVRIVEREIMVRIGGERGG